MFSIVFMGYQKGDLALNHVQLELWAEIGATNLRVGQLLQIGRGAVIALDKSVEGEVDLKIGQHLVARGNLLVEEPYFAVSVTKTSVDIHE